MFLIDVSSVFYINFRILKNNWYNYKVMYGIKRKLIKPADAREINVT